MDLETKLKQAGVAFETLAADLKPLIGHCHEKDTPTLKGYRILILKWMDDPSKLNLTIEEAAALLKEIEGVLQKRGALKAKEAEESSSVALMDYRRINILEGELAVENIHVQVPCTIRFTNRDEVEYEISIDGKKEKLLPGDEAVFILKKPGEYEVKIDGKVAGHIFVEEGKATLIKDIKNYDASSLPTKVLQDDWRIVCAWWSAIKSGKKFKYTEDEVLDLARKIVAELVKRNITFHPSKYQKAAKDLFEKVRDLIPEDQIVEAEEASYPTIKFGLKKYKGLYLVAPHAELIAKKKKKMIVKSKHYHIYNEEFVVVQDDKAYARIKIEPYEPVLIRDVETFNLLRDDHCITDEERKAWWDDKFPLYGYEFRLLEVFDPPKKVKVKKGTQTFITSVEMAKARTTEAERMAKQSIEEDKVKPLRFFYSLKGIRGYHEGEVYSIKACVDLVGNNYPVVCQKKYDGLRIFIHKKGKEVQFWTEDGWERGERFPHTKEEILKWPYDLVLDCECELWRGKVHGGREEASGYTHRKGKGDDKDIVFNVHDCLYFYAHEAEKKHDLNMKIGDLHNQPYVVRLKYLDLLPFQQATDEYPDPKISHLNKVPSHIANNPEELGRAIEDCSKLPYSEGCMIKLGSSKYPLTGITEEWIKYKKMADVHAIVVGRIETKTKGVYNYEIGLGFSPDDNVAEEDIREIKGKKYAYVGKTFNTNVYCEIGEIITVVFHTFFIHYTPKGNKYRIYEPNFYEIRPEQTVPDTIKDGIEVAKAAGLLQEKHSLAQPTYKMAAFPISSLPNTHVSFGTPQQLFSSNKLEEFFTFCKKKNIPSCIIHPFYGIVPKTYKVPKVGKMETNPANFIDVIDRTASEFNVKHLVILRRGFVLDKDYEEALLKTNVFVEFVDNLEQLEKKFYRQPTLEEFQQKLVEWPPEDKEYRFVMQHHWRGKGCHMDFRCEVNDHLEGWTINDAPKGEAKEEVHDLKTARKLEDEIDWKFTNLPGNRGMKCMAEAKAKQPKLWLDVEGEMPPGSVGATKEHPGVFLIIDKGTVEFGVRKPYFYEYFLHGKKFDGRFVIRVLTPQWELEQPKTKVGFVFFAWKPEDQTPYMLTDRPLEIGYVPPQGISALPKEIRERIPEKYQYWKFASRAKRFEVLKQLHEAIKNNEVKLHKLEKKSESGFVSVGYSSKPTAEFGDGVYKLNEDYYTVEGGKISLKTVPFVLQHHWWKGQKVIRAGPSAEHWDLRWKIDNRIEHFVLLEDPRYVEATTGYTKPCKDLKSLNYGKKGPMYCPPGTPLNPTKDTPAWIEAVDYGKVIIYEDKDFFKRVEFKGKLLTGLWVFKREPQSEIWTMERSELPGEKIRESLSLEVRTNLSTCIKLEEGNFFTAIALSPGVWNNLYFPPEVITDRPFRIVGVPICIEHDERKVVGKVVDAKAKGDDLIVKFEIWDPEIAKEISEGKWNGVSIDAYVYADRERRIVQKIRSYNELSLTKSPACTVCKILAS